jgi:hypothetical protein
LLSYVTIYVRNDSRISGLHVVLDKDREITEPMWQTKLPVDPGEHAIVVDAPGRIPKSYKVNVKDGADWESVDVLPLVLAPVVEGPKPTTTGNPGRRTAGYAVGAVGLAALGTGAVFGGFALAKNADVTKLCGDYVCQPGVDRDTANNRENDAKTFALMTDIALSVGTVMLITGAVMVWTGRVRPVARTGMNLRAAPGTHGGSMLLEGTF